MKENNAQSLGITSRQSRSNQIRLIAGTAMLSAVSFLLAFLEVPVPFSPPFARFDFADLPALIGAFAYGPIWGVAVELVKNLLRLTTTATGGIGELANFTIGSALVFPAGLIYMTNKSRKTAMIGCCVGSVASGVAAAVMNYFVLLPMFEIFMPLEEVIAAFAESIPFIHTKLDVVLYNALPMNILRAALISFVTMLIYKQLSPILKGRR